MALFRNLLQTIKNFKVDIMQKKDISTQVEVVRGLRENFKRLDVQKKDVENRKKIMQQNVDSVVSEIERIRKDKASAIESAALGEIGEAPGSLRKLKEEEARLKAELADSEEIMKSLDKVLVEIRTELSKPLSGPIDQLKAAEITLWRSIYDELLEEFIRTSGSKLKECFTAYKAANGRDNMLHGDYLEEAFGKLEPQRDEQAVLLTELSKRYGLTENQ